MSTTPLPPVRLSTPGAPDAELIAYYEQMRDYYPKAEPETRQWCVRNFAPDWVTFDVGANVGLYATLFSRLSPRGQVYAFEPTETADILRTNLAHNACANVVFEVLHGEAETPRRKAQA